MIFRLSQQLARKIKAGPLDTLPLDENPFADWSAHFFVVNRSQYVILSNTKTLYSCLMSAAGINDKSRFVERASTAIREFMQDDGQQLAYAKFMSTTSSPVQFAKALNRTVIGSINELIFSADHVLSDGDVSPHEVGFQINQVLLSALASEGFRGYGKPREAFLKLVARHLH